MNLPVRRMALPVLVMLMLAVGCSVPTDTSASVIPVDDLPESLRPDFTATTTTIEAPITATASVYLLTRQAETTRATVVRVQREVPFNPTLFDVISRLFGDGSVNPDEEASNYTTTLNEFELLSATQVGGTAILDIVNLTPEGLPSDQPFEGDLIEVAAQLVWTATEYPGVAQVQILIGGELVTIPTNEGDTDVGAVVTRSDYERFDPDFVPPSTTTTTTVPGTTDPATTDPITTSAP